MRKKLFNTERGNNIRIKKFGFSGAFLFIFLICNTANFAYGYDEKPSYQLLISAVMGYANNKAMNNSTKSVARYDADWLNSLPVSPQYPSPRFSVDNTSANFSGGCDVDFRYFFDNFGIGLQSGYHIARAESEMTEPRYVDKSTTTYELSVVPVVSTLFYRITRSSNSFILLGGGIGYYFGKVKFDYEDKITIPPNYSYSFSGKQSKVGVHALIEYDYILDNGITFFGGVKYRYIQFDKFKKGGKVAQELGYGPNGIPVKNLKAGLTGVTAYIGAGVSF